MDDGGGKPAPPPLYQNRQGNARRIENIERKETPQKRYDRTHTTRVALKLNNRTDTDILEYLADKPKQTEIKRCLRMAIKQKEEQKK